MSVLITGGAGYVGSALTRRLIEIGHHVVSIDNLTRGSYEHLQPYYCSGKLNPLVGDICDIDALERAVKKAGELDVIFHLAALPGVDMCKKRPREAVLTNVYGSYNVLEVARKHDVDLIVLTSSAAVYGDPLEVPVPETHPTMPRNLYGITKLMAERLFLSYYQLYGLCTVILRLANIYGLGLFTYWDNVIPKFVRLGLEGKPLSVYWTGEQTRDFIHVEDVVSALELVLKADKKTISGEVFNVATGRPVTINEVAETVKELIERELGRSVKIEHGPPPNERSETLVPGFCLSAKKIQNTLGFRPSRTLEEGVSQLISYYCSRFLKGTGA